MFEEKEKMKDLSDYIDDIRRGCEELEKNAEKNIIIIDHLELLKV